MPGRHQLLQNAIILDTETLGIQRGAGMHELAVFNLETQALHEYILKPNMVQVASATAQEHTRLATSTLDIHQLVNAPNWIDIIRKQLVMGGQLTKAATDTEVLSALEIASPWLAKRLGNYPHLTGGALSSTDEANRLAMLRSKGGISSFSSQVVDVAAMMGKGGILQQAIAGKTIWGANVGFESKQVGALTAGLEAAGIETNLKATLQTSGTTGDPFYTTGAEVNQAKVLAQQTGDWTGVWKAYLSDTPKAGETAVRDIQDVIRSMMSYGQKLGLQKEGDVYWGTALDVVYRLMGSMGPDGAEFLHSKEVHRAAEDVAIHSQFVLERALKWTSALQAVHENTPEGKELIKQALNKEGALFEAATFLKRQESVKPFIQQQSLVQRLGRAQSDILEQGQTWQVDGWRRVKELTQTTPSGADVKVPILEPNRVSMSSMDQLVPLLAAQKRYGSEADIAAQLLSMNEVLGKGTTAVEKKRLLAQYLDEKTAGVLEGQIEAQSENILKMYNQDLGKLLTRSSRSGKVMADLAEMLPTAKAPALLTGWGLFAGATATMGMVWSMTAGNTKPAREQPSLLTYDYHDWLKHQGQMFGQRGMDERNQGMSERGVLGAMRSTLTDFGSPYQGIMGSQAVFDQQELYREREKWMRQQYGAVHYDPTSGLFGMAGILSRARHQGYTYIPDGTPVGKGYQNLRGGNLMRINLGDGGWKLNVEDADTIVLKRGGLRGAVGSIFGLNKGYAFRLAGVDAPETAHDNRAAQPSAMTSLQALNIYLKNESNVELVFDPDQTTYGRTMAVAFAGGKNVNYELIKRGWAGFLPYGNPSNSMIDYQIMRGMETAAAGSDRGMWQHPFWQVLYDSTKGKDRPTFNTLTRKEKIVENYANMQMVSLMEQAQEMGMYNTEMAIDAAAIAKIKRRGVDEVRPAVMQGNKSAHYDGYINQMLSENSQWMSNHGSKRRDKHFSARGGYRNYDKALVLDTMGHTNSVWARRKLYAFGRYGSGDALAIDRKMSMAESQRAINQTIFQNQQNHTFFN